MANIEYTTTGKPYAVDENGVVLFIPDLLASGDPEKVALGRFMDEELERAARRLRVGDEAPSA